VRYPSKALKICVACLALVSTAVHAERNIDRDLRNASQAGDLNEMERQLKLGADPNVAYALWAAAEAGQLPAVQFLLAHGADPNAWTRIAIRLPRGPAASPLFAAARHGNRSMLTYLKSHGADPNAQTTDPSSASCSTALIEALCEGDLTAAQLLIEAGANVNRRSSTGDPPLQFALRAPHDRESLVELLLHHGADPDAKGTRGDSLRDDARLIPGLPALVEQIKPLAPGKMRQEEPLEVLAALHYKSLCDMGLPGYADQVKADYATWRKAQAEVIARIESSPDYPQEQASAKATFDEQRAQAGGVEAAQFAQSLHQICEGRLAAHFRNGAPLFEEAPDPQAQQAIQTLAAPQTTVTTTVRKAPSVVGGSVPARYGAERTTGNP